jgi:hypothetical protein
VTRERIRQIEAKVLQKLRDHPRSACIREHHQVSTSKFGAPTFATGKLCPECRKGTMVELMKLGKPVMKCDHCAYTLDLV